MKKLFSVRNEASEPAAQIMCYGPLGEKNGSNAVVPADFKAALDAIGRDREIVVRINSPGGNLWDGMAIHNMLSAIRSRVVCAIDGLAGSAASIIALAGRKCTIPKAGLFMIHMPVIGTYGSAADLRAEAEKLDKHTDIIVGIYQEKTGKPESQILAAMEKETWFSGTEAFDFGFADELSEEEPAAATALGFDFTAAGFKHVPPEILRAVQGEAYQVAGDEEETQEMRERLDRIEATERSIAWIKAWTAEHMPELAAEIDGRPGL